MKKECSSCAFGTLDARYLPCNGSVVPKYHCSAKKKDLLDKKVPKDDCAWYDKNKVWS